MKRIPMTQHGADQLKEELHRLKTQDRPKVVNAIAEARAHGDLKENAEYHAAREQQSFIEGRILEIESKLSAAQVIDVTKIDNAGKVIFGVTVDIVDVETEQMKTYTIVGDDEADLKENKISVNSPVARGLIGKSIEDEISINTPSGEVIYVIEAVRHL